MRTKPIGDLLEVPKRQCRLKKGDVKNTKVEDREKERVLVTNREGLQDQQKRAKEDDIVDDEEDNVNDPGDGFSGLDVAGRVALGIARMSPVRRMVRELIVRYPLLLGTGIGRIEARLADFIHLMQMSVPVRTDAGTRVHTEVGRVLRWDAFIQVLRRSDDMHVKWVERAEVDIQAAVNKAMQERTAAAEVREDSKIHKNGGKTKAKVAVKKRRMR